MPSDKQQTSNKGVQTDSAQPSRSRSRVRSLLGIPADEAGHLVFSPPTPLVGFKYADAPSMSEPQMDSAWIELEDFQEADPEDFQPHASIEEPPDASEMSQGSVLEEETELMIPESKPKAVSVELTEKSELPNPGIEQVRMEVPSVSRSPSTTPGMANAKEDDAPEVLPSQQDLPTQTVDQHHSRPESKPESVAVKETQNVGTTDVVPEVERASIEIPGVSERQPTFPALVNAKEDDAPEMARPQQDTRIESKPQPAQSVRPQAIVPEVERSNMEIPGVSERQPTFPALANAKEDDAPEVPPPQQDLPTQTVDQHHSRPESRPESVAVEETQNVGTTDVVPEVERASMEIPGVSERQPTFPALANAKEDDAPEMARPQQDLPTRTIDQQGTRIESKPQPAQSVRPQAIVPEVERSNMEIPGVSERQPTFPALANAKEDDASEVAPPQQDLPTRTIDQQGTRIESKPQPAQDVRPQAIAPEVERANMEIPGVSEGSPTFPASSLANEVAPPSDGTEDRSSWQDSVGPSESASPLTATNSLAWGREMGNKETQGKGAGEQGGRIAEEGVSKEESELKPNMPMSALSRSPLSTHSASRPFGAEAVSRSNRDTAETIEQLRHALQELNSKVASQQEKMNGEGRVREAATRQQPPEQLPSPPPQTVVIIKRSSHPERTPHAFWERSYLNRFHRRPLR